MCEGFCQLAMLTLASVSLACTSGQLKHWVEWRYCCMFAFLMTTRRDVLGSPVESNAAVLRLLGQVTLWTRLTLLFSRYSVYIHHQRWHVPVACFSDCGVTMVRKLWRMHTFVSLTPQQLGQNYWRTWYFQVKRCASVSVIMLQVLMTSFIWFKSLSSLSGIGAFTIVDGHTVSGEDVGNK